MREKLIHRRFGVWLVPWVGSAELALGVVAWAQRIGHRLLISTLGTNSDNHELPLKLRSLLAGRPVELETALSAGSALGQAQFPVNLLLGIAEQRQLEAGSGEDLRATRDRLFI